MGGDITPNPDSRRTSTISDTESSPIRCSQVHIQRCPSSEMQKSTCDCSCGGLSECHTTAKVHCARSRDGSPCGKVDTPTTCDSQNTCALFADNTPLIRCH